MRSIATMIVTSRTTGMLLVNQLPAGQVGPDEAISVPMPDEGHCFLTFLPYDDHALPLHKLLHWHEGRPRLDEACKGGVELKMCIRDRSSLRVEISTPNPRVRRRSSSFVTLQQPSISSKISTMGFATRPSTAVLPIWLMRTTSCVLTTWRICCLSVSYHSA